MLKFLKALFSGIPKYVPNPNATPDQKFALAASAVLSEVNGCQHEWLHGGPPDAVSASGARAVLAKGWSVDGRETLLGTLAWLESEGHRLEYERLRTVFERKGTVPQDPWDLFADEPWTQNLTMEEKGALRTKAIGMLGFWESHRSLLGWDLGRAIWLCRWGALASYLSDEEAWQRILGYATELHQAFGSWAELGENYRAGFNFWSEDDEDDDVASALKVLQDPKNTNSPWALNPWQ